MIHGATRPAPRLAFALSLLVLLGGCGEKDVDELIDELQYSEEKGTEAESTTAGHSPRADAAL